MLLTDARWPGILIDVTGGSGGLRCAFSQTVTELRISNLGVVLFQQVLQAIRLFLLTKHQHSQRTTALVTSRTGFECGSHTTPTYA